MSRAEVDAGTLSRLFPFSIEEGPDGTISGLGPSLAKVMQVVSGGRLIDQFERTAPEAGDTLQDLVGAPLVILIHRTRRLLRMRGQVVRAGGAVLFLGSPVITDPQQMLSLGLAINDFPPHDLTNDFLLLSSAQQASLADATNLAEALALLNRDLEERVRTRTSTLTEQARKLEEANRRLEEEVGIRRRAEAELEVAHRLESVGQLAAGIAHEINTPIQFIGDNLRFLRDALSGYATAVAAMDRALGGDEAAVAAARAATEAADLPFLADEAPKALEQSLEGVERVASLVRAMKEFSYPESGERKPADLNHGVTTTLAVAKNEYKYVADVVVQLDSALPPVPCLIGEINQVVLNLVVNAAHAIAERVGPSGRGTITVATRVRDGWAEISVGDTGTGIPPEHRERIFEPFFTTKPVGKGTGQGLYLVHTIITKKHQGRILLASELGVGTTFTIRLPLVVTEAAP